MNADEYRETLAFLEKTPLLVARLVQGLDRNALRMRGPGDTFSALEQVCHLRDIEHEGYLVRARRMLAQDNPLLEDIDGGKLAQERNYRSQDLAAALQAFEAARRETWQLLQNASLAERERKGSFRSAADNPAGTAITLAGLADMMRVHDSGHLAELGALRAQLGAGI